MLQVIMGILLLIRVIYTIIISIVDVEQVVFQL